MPSPDHSTTSPVPGLPTPPSSGVGAADLTTESTDPQELRDLLDRARERLAFYESFDRIIGENIRRSGELMVETVALREQAQAIAKQSAQERARFEATRQADQDHYRAIIQQALDEAVSVRPVIDAMVERLHGVLAQLDAVTAERTGATTSTDASVGPNVATTADLVEPWITSSEHPDSINVGEAIINEECTPDTIPDVAVVEESATEAADPVNIDIDTEAVPESEPDTKTSAEPIADEPVASAEPRNIDVLAHGVPSARTAIALQKMLRGLDVVSNVEAREFADGELRLTVTATATLPVDALSIWLTDNRGELTRTADTVIEVTFRED